MLVKRLYSGLVKEFSTIGGGAIKTLIQRTTPMMSNPRNWINELFLKNLISIKV
jgi:hypothetical protein